MATTKDQQKAAAAAASEGIDFSADAGQGREGVGSSDMALPYLTILQDLSPQVKKSNEKHIPDAEPGMIFNTLTNEIIDGQTGVFFIPCAFQKLFVEWKPRSTGGGFVQAHVDASILQKTRKDDRGKDVLENGNLIVTTAYHLGIIATTMQKVIVAMASTQLKKSRKWNSIMAEIILKDKDGRPMRDAVTGRPLIAPTYSRVYRLNTVLERKDQHSWYGWNITLVDAVKDKGTYLESRESHALFKGSSNLLTNSRPPDDAEDADKGVL